MRKSLLSTLLVLSISSFAQERVRETFEDTRVVNGHSVETNKEGSMKMIIAHRFGMLNGGLYDLFGLDDAQIRLGLDYGLTDYITIGLGRSSFQKTVDGFIKARLMTQKTGGGSPISITWFSSADLNTEKRPPGEEIDYSLRWSYTHQLLLARKFGEDFSLQVMPTFLHRNLVFNKEYNNDIISIGTAGKLRLTQMLSFKVEYYFTLPNQLPKANTNSLALGFDIETKHHVFQLHVSNSRGMTEKFFISETNGQWSKGDIMLGFNITRDFQIKGRKYK